MGHIWHLTSLLLKLKCFVVNLTNSLSSTGNQYFTFPLFPSSSSRSRCSALNVIRYGSNGGKNENGKMGNLGKMRRSKGGVGPSSPLAGVEKNLTVKNDILYCQWRRLRRSAGPFIEVRRAIKKSKVVKKKAANFFKDLLLSVREYQEGLFVVNFLVKTYTLWRVRKHHAGRNYFDLIKGPADTNKGHGTFIHLCYSSTLFRSTNKCH